MQLKQKIVIIGGTGFIGSALAKTLSTKHSIELSIIHRSSLSGNKLPNVYYHKIDTVEESKKLGETTRNADCLVILSQPDKQLIENITRYSSGIKKIIYASTLLLYPDSPDKQNENSPLKPVNNYEESKLFEEQALTTYAKDKNIKLCITRLTNIYGDVKNRGIIQKIFLAILNNKQLTINGTGNQLRDYSFIEDVVAPLAYLISANQDKLVEVFNICSGEGHTLNEAISIIEEISGKKLLRIEGDAIKEKSIIIGDDTKIIKFTGIKPLFNLREGLIKTYQNNLKHSRST